MACIGGDTRSSGIELARALPEVVVTAELASANASALTQTEDTGI